MPDAQFLFHHADLLAELKREIHIRASLYTRQAIANPRLAPTLHKQMAAMYCAYHALSKAPITHTLHYCQSTHTITEIALPTPPLKT